MKEKGKEGRRFHETLKFHETSPSQVVPFPVNPG